MSTSAYPGPMNVARRQREQREAELAQAVLANCIAVPYLLSLAGSTCLIPPEDESILSLALMKKPWYQEAAAGRDLHLVLGRLNGNLVAVSSKRWGGVLQFQHNNPQLRDTLCVHHLVSTVLLFRLDVITIRPTRVPSLVKLATSGDVLFRPADPFDRPSLSGGLPVLVKAKEVNWSSLPWAVEELQPAATRVAPRAGTTSANPQPVTSTSTLTPQQ